MSHRWAQRSPRWGETELERRVGGRHLEPIELRGVHRRRTSRKSVRWRHFYTCNSNKPRDVLALLLRCFVRFERYRHRCPAWLFSTVLRELSLHASARQLSERGQKREKRGETLCIPRRGRKASVGVDESACNNHCRAEKHTYRPLRCEIAGPSCRVNMYSSVRRGTLADARAS